MTNKILDLAIDALLTLTGHLSHAPSQFHTDVDEAIKSLRKVKKYL